MKNTVSPGLTFRLISRAKVSRAVLLFICLIAIVPVEIKICFWKQMIKTEFRAYISLIVLKTLRMGFSSKIRALKCRYLPVRICVWVKCPAPILFCGGLGLDQAATHSQIPGAFQSLKTPWSQQTWHLTFGTVSLCEGSLEIHGLLQGISNVSTSCVGTNESNPLWVPYFNLEIYLVYPKVTAHTLAAAGVQLPECAGQISSGYMSFET